MSLSRKPLSNNKTNENINSPAISELELLKRRDNIVNIYTFDTKRSRSSLPAQIFSNRDRENAMDPKQNVQKEQFNYAKRQSTRSTQQETATTPRRKTLPLLQKEGELFEQEKESTPFWNTRSSSSFTVHKDNTEDSNQKTHLQSSKQELRHSQQEEPWQLRLRKSILGSVQKITSVSTKSSPISSKITTLSTQLMQKETLSKSPNTLPKSTTKASLMSDSSSSKFSTKSSPCESSAKSSPTSKPLSSRSTAKLSPTPKPASSKSTPKSSAIKSIRKSPRQLSAMKNAECVEKKDTKNKKKEDMKAEKKEEKIKEKKNIKSESNKEEFVPYMAIKTEPGTAENRDKMPKPDPRYSIKYANTLPVIDTMRQETKKEEQATWGNLFEDASIKSLPNDLLLMIFEYCKDTETLYTLPQVCRHWRRLTLEPSLWRSVSYQWPDFVEQLRILRENKKIFSVNSIKRTIPMIKKLTIKATAEGYDMVEISQFQPTHRSPFTQLQHLHLINMDLSDIQFIVREYAPHISILICENIQVSHMYGDFSMPNFSSMPNLKQLKLHFARRSGFGIVVSGFDLTSRRSPPQNLDSSISHILPTSLEQLEITNVYNREEYLLRPQDATKAIVSQMVMEGNEHGYLMQEMIENWNNLERQLVTKYNMLTNLTSLTCLSLDRITAFTARVWRECMIPCASQLEYLSLSGWTVNSRESPLDMMTRARTLTTTTQEEKMEGVELALSEFISALSNIKQITLNQFICGEGLVLGLDQFVKTSKKSYCCIVDDEQSHYLIRHYLGSRLYNFKIVIK